MLEIVEDAIGSIGLSGLVNNAGIAIGGPLEFLSLERLRNQLEINVIGQIAVTQAFLPLLRQRQGRIVNMSSVSGRLAAPFIGPYSASKFALEALTDALRGELHPWGIHVVSVEPGSIATPIWNKARSLSSEIAAELPDQAHALYDQALEDLMRTVEASGRRGIPPEVVARVVERALTSRRPKTRYLVGVDAHVGALMSRLLPDRLRDWLIFNFYRHS
jgi:NAD(P)-dependent dehydrogenase (short-subunit alcohol dehydrogenase family)